MGDNYTKKIHWKSAKKKMFPFTILSLYSFTIQDSATTFTDITYKRNLGNQTQNLFRRSGSQAGDLFCHHLLYVGWGKRQNQDLVLFNCFEADRLLSVLESKDISYEGSDTFKFAVSCKVYCHRICTLYKLHKKMKKLRLLKLPSNGSSSNIV
jgi:hypothetical protein